MASIEFVNKRIEGLRKEIARLEKKIARIIKAKESNWENNPYYYSEYDLKQATKDIQEAKENLAKYQAVLITENEKDNSRNVKPIIDFLEKWAERVYNWYEDAFVKYQVAYKKHIKEIEQYCEMGCIRRERYADYKDAVKKFNAKWNFLYPYIDRKEFNSQKLRKELEQEKKAKYDDIVNRANKICGTITDATGLSVGEKGELNGLVIGDRGRAYIKTIGAGGYNIQCYHFRTLIHERK